MTNSKLRALLQSADMNIDCAMNSLVYKENPSVFEDLNNARDLISVALDSLGHPDDPGELDFD